MGAGIILIPIFFLYALLMAAFCMLIASRTSERTGWLMSVPLIFLPLAVLVGVLIP